MKLIFKDFDTKEIIATKMIDVGAHVPRSHETVRIAKSRCVVVGVDYYLSSLQDELYDRIEVSVQVFVATE
jgi:hypothetical protein